MGAPLAQAQSWLSKRREDLSVVDREFIDQSSRRENKARSRARRARALVYVLLVGSIGGLIGWINQSYVRRGVEVVLDQAALPGAEGGRLSTQACRTSGR